MMKILDYYFLVLLRKFGRIYDDRVIGSMVFTMLGNLFSLIILFTAPRILNQEGFLLTLLIVWIILFTVIYWTFCIVYNEKRIERIIVKYKRENRESRRRGVFKVVLYKLLSLVFFIFVILIII